MYSGSTLHFSNPTKPAKPAYKRSDAMPSKVGFLRLDSLEDTEPEMIAKPTTTTPTSVRNCAEDCRWSSSASHVHRSAQNSHKLPGEARPFSLTFPFPNGRAIPQVPYNLTKGRYEYWSSLPYPSAPPPVSKESSFYSCSRVEFVLDQPCRGAVWPAQISKTFTSLVGGVCDWVAGTLDSASAFRKISSGKGGVASSSQLNPNAKCFTPLNPLAREFRPCSARVSMKEAKSEAEASSAAEDVSSSPRSDDCRSHEDKANGGLPPTKELENGCSRESLDAEPLTDEEEADVDDDCACPRSRSFSCCSDDSFIEFGTPMSSVEEPAPERCDKIVRKSPEFAQQKEVRKPCAGKKLFLVFLNRPDSEEEDSEEDADWDEIDSSKPVFDEDVLNEFQPLTFDVVGKRSECASGPRCPRLPPEEAYPLSPECQQNKEDLDRRLRDANAAWDRHYSPSLHNPAVADRKKSSVSIAPSESFVYIDEDPELFDALAESRRGDFQRRQADKERMELLLAPIFAARHRKNVWERLKRKEGKKS